MPNHQRVPSHLLLGKSPRNCAASSRITISPSERHEVRHPERRRGPKTAAMGPRVARRARFRLFNQQACPLRRRLGFRRSIALDVHERQFASAGPEALSAQRRSAGVPGKRRDLIEGACELFCGFEQRRAVERSRWPALPHRRRAAFSIKPASVQCRASSSGWFSATSANWVSRVSAIRA